MRALFRNPAFVKLFTASFASQMGTTIGNMAFAFYLLDHFAHQPAYASLAELMYALPTLVVFFLVGVVADRFDRQRIAEYTGWIRLVLTFVLLGAVYLGSLPIVFVILFLRSAVAKFYAPAETALLQGVMPEEQYERAAGLNQMIFGIFMLFGVGMGALAYSTIGIYGAIMLDGLGFIVSAMLVRGCRIDQAVRKPAGDASWRSLHIRSVLADFRSGVRYVFQTRLLLALIGGFLLFGLMNGAFAVLPMFTMKYKLVPDAYEKFMSLFAIFLGIGFLIGSAIGAELTKRLKPHIVIIVCLLLTSGSAALLGLADNVWLYLVLIGFSGILLAPLNIAIGGWLPRIVEPSKMGRVIGLTDPVLMLGQSAALGLISLLYPQWLSLTVIYMVLAGVLLAAFLLYFATLPRMARSSKEQVQQSA